MDKAENFLFDTMAIIGEIFASPLGLVVLIACLWRLLKGDGPTVILSSAVGAIIVVSIGIATLPSVLNSQDRILEEFRTHLSYEDWAQLNLEQYTFSEKAALLAWTFLALIMLPQDQPWHRKMLSFIGFAIVTSLFSLSFYFLFSKFGSPALAPTANYLVERELWMKQFAAAAAYQIKLPLSAFAWGTSLYIFLCICYTYITRSLRETENPVKIKILNTTMTILITVILLGFAFAGFFFLPAYQATLWLFFWIVAYPPALAFARAEPLPSKDLVTIYKAGLAQIPFIGKFLSGLMPKTLKRRKSTPRKDAKSTSD